ncbi:MAG: hypothetical protein ABF868_12385 [Sporolactobacillus sp.]
MNYDLYNPYRANQNPNFSGPMNPMGTAPMNAYPSFNMNTAASPAMTTNQPTATKDLKSNVLSAIEPLIPSLRAVTAMAYLMGMGHTYQQAKQLVESWELGKMASRDTY